jgi:drug/metabolite transporter (DMT)-like permease
LAFTIYNINVTNRVSTYRTRLSCAAFFMEGNFMWNMIWPILVVVAANTIYNISAKSTPSTINPFASLLVSYLVAATCAAVLFFVTSEQKNLGAELVKANWATFSLGAAIVFLEFGFLCIYRVGWKMSTANLIASIVLACVLLIVGIFLYKETLSMRQILGMVVCGVGLVLITK